MYIESLNLDINNISKYTKDDIKDIYKKIALECHPDKLINITDINEKNQKIDKIHGHLIRSLFAKRIPVTLKKIEAC